MQSQPRTSHQEAAEISSVIQQTAQVMEHRKEQHQNRRVSVNDEPINSLIEYRVSLLSPAVPAELPIPDE